jgi:hypothetical protein
MLGFLGNITSASCCVTIFIGSWNQNIFCIFFKFLFLAFVPVLSSSKQTTLVLAPSSIVLTFRTIGKKPSLRLETQDNSQEI